ncbi:hypothetical protein G9A89_005993 [Geosiphon pyriformis]|nr:hypothetical protein G9A89_005993 [Geosiphon pyriformis]
MTSEDFFLNSNNLNIDLEEQSLLMEPEPITQFAYTSIDNEKINTDFDINPIDKEPMDHLVAKWSPLNGVWSGEQQIKETPSRKQITSNSFITKLKHYVFLANEANCGTFGDWAFSPEVRGFILIIESTSQIIIGLRRHKPLMGVEDWPWKNNPMESIGKNSPGDVLVHAEIFKLYSMAKSRLLSNVKEMVAISKHRNFEIVLIGEGIGGAYASLAALDIHKIAPANPIKVFTFGQPRLGNLAFAKYINSFSPALRVYRVTHYKDNVPLIPTSDEGYHHCDQEIWITGTNSRNPLAFQCISINDVENQECINSKRINNADHSLHYTSYFNTKFGSCAFTQHEKS